VRFRTVCVSAEDGAGGLPTATRAAETLGLRLIDEDIVTRAAVEAGVDRDVVADVEARKSRLARLLDTLGTSSVAAGLAAGYVVPDAISADLQPASDELRGLIRSVIEDTAAAGGAMIVSHAASLALADRDDVLRVLVTASTETRRERFADSLGLDRDEARRALDRSDAGRADYIKRFYGLGSERPTHYDLVVNTDRLTPQEAADLIVTAARMTA
jgi:Cytidylate kinase-like family